MLRLRNLAGAGRVIIACIIASVGLAGFYCRRSRFPPSQLVALTMFPVGAALAHLLQDLLDAIEPAGVNPFVFCTTAGLWVFTYSLLRGRFLEVLRIARALMLNLIHEPEANRAIELATHGGARGGTRFFQVHLVRLDPRDWRSDVLVLLRDVTEQTLAHEAAGEPGEAAEPQRRADAVVHHGSAHRIARWQES